MRVICGLLLLFCPLLQATPGQNVRILGLQSNTEASVVYYRDLLRLVLNNTAAEYGPAQLELIAPPALGDYRYLLMKQDFVDVHHFGTSPELERDLLPIRVPLLAGGLGWRGFIIRKMDKRAFAQISDFAELKRLTACQGELWPDSAIMRASGLHVLTAERHDQMLDLLRRERCDYFPRSIFEGPIEQKAFQVQYPDLEFNTSVLLHYPFAMYFFVKKDNLALAARLEKGLSQLAQSGELIRFLQQHPISRQVFPLSRFRKSLVFHLTNPVLPAETPLDQAAFWFTMPSVQTEIAVAPLR